MRHMKLISKKTDEYYEVTNQSNDMIFKSDEPTKVGGSGKYPRPTELMLGALGSCLNITIRSVAKKRGYTIKSLEIEIESDVETHGIIDEKIKDGFYNTGIKIKMDSDIPTDEKEHFLQFCITACPVHAAIENATNINWEY